MAEETIIEEVKEVKKISLDELPFHELKRALKEKEIAFKVTDKKPDLVKMLREGETKHKPKEAKHMPQLGEKRGEKSIPMIPIEIKPQLDELAKKGLTWVIDDIHGCVTFTRDLSTCANLDQSAVNILRTAQQAFRGRFGGGFTIEAGNAAQAKSLDNK